MNIKNKKTIVIKIGTTSLIDEGKLSQPLLHSLAEKIKQHQNTHNFVIVTSGAVSLGGMAAHLAGVVAAHTTLPVIGIPIPSGSLNGMDSLLSTVQMPPGIPVATVAIGSSGAKNAAILAVQILATADDTLKQKLTDYKVNMKDEVLAKDAKLNS